MNIIDVLVKKNTCFDSMQDMISRQPLHGYFPTIRVNESKEMKLIADVYDSLAEFYSLEHKCYRSSQK